MGKEVVEIYLDDICKELAILPTQLIDEINREHYRVRPGTVYDLYNREAKRVSLDKLAIIITTLNKISSEMRLNKVYDVSDILKYKVI